MPFEKKCLHYVQGGFFGGPSSEFLKMSRILRDWTAEDIRNGIIPVWHDESMLNAFLSDKQYDVLPRDIMLPEERRLPKTIAIFRNKSNYGGNAVLREGKRKALWKKLKNLWKKIWKKC